MGTRDHEKLLTVRELAMILAAVLPIFVFLGGPVWTHPYRIDSAVYWSYAPVPFLVLVVLFRRRVLSLAGFLVNTITALSVKYLLTTTAAFVLWTTFDPPALAVAPPATDQTRAANKSARAVRDGREAIELDFDGRAITPSGIEVRADQPLVFRSRDGQLHTVRAVREDGSIAFNRPVIPGRPIEPIFLAKTPGRYSLSCAVHEHEVHAMIVSMPEQ